jgi:tetratricopeptide (TPR) repeat protein
MRLRPASIAAIVCTLFAITRSASSAKDSAVAEAKAHFHLGSAFYEAHSYDRALVEYEAAYKAKPLPQFLFNIAQALRQLHQRDRSIETYNRFLVKQPDGPAADEARSWIVKLTLESDAEAKKGSAPTETSDASPASDPMSAVEVEILLQEAQDDYVHGQYPRAIEKARRAVRYEPGRAWRIIGSSSCFLKDEAGAAAAWDQLDGQGRNFVKYVCNRQVIATPQ